MPALDNRQWLNENKQLGAAMPTRQPNIGIPKLSNVDRFTAPPSQIPDRDVLSYDMPRQKPNQSRYSAKKEKLEATEENRPEMNIAEMLVDGFLNKKFGITPYAYGMSQAEKDIQKQRAGVDVERQKATKKAIGVMHQVADHSSQYYGDLPHMAKQLNKNPEIWGKLDNIKTTGKVPALDSQGNQNEFAGLPLYTFNRTDPDTGETETMTASVPEMIENYHNGLSPANQVAAERVVLRTQKQKELEAQREAAGFEYTETRYADPKTGRRIYEAVFKDGRRVFTNGLFDQEGNLIPIEKDVQVKELKKPTTEFQERSLDIKKRRLALDREKARKGKASSKKDLKDKIWKEMAAAEKTARSSDEFMTLEPSQQAQHIDKIREAAGFKFYAYEKGFKPQRNKKTGEMVYVEKIGKDKIRVYNEFGQELPAPGEKPSKKQLAGGNKFKKLLTMDYKKNKEKKYKSSKITGETGAPLISEGLKRIPGQVVSAGGTVVKGAGGLLGKAGGALMESQRKARKESLGF